MIYNEDVKLYLDLRKAKDSLDLIDEMNEVEKKTPYVLYIANARAISDSIYSAYSNFNVFKKFFLFYKYYTLGFKKRITEVWILKNWNMKQIDSCITTLIEIGDIEVSEKKKMTETESQSQEK